LLTVASHRDIDAAAHPLRPPPCLCASRHPPAPQEQLREPGALRGVTIVDLDRDTVTVTDDVPQLPAAPLVRLLHQARAALHEPLASPDDPFAPCEAARSRQRQPPAPPPTPSQPQPQAAEAAAAATTTTTTTTTTSAAALECRQERGLRHAFASFFATLLFNIDTFLVGRSSSTSVTDDTAAGGGAQPVSWEDSPVREQDFLDDWAAAYGADTSTTRLSVSSSFDDVVDKCDAGLEFMRELLQTQMLSQFASERRRWIQLMRSAALDGVSPVRSTNQLRKSLLVVHSAAVRWVAPCHVSHLVCAQNIDRGPCRGLFQAGNS
jgi:hypothetical protein